MGKNGIAYSWHAAKQNSRILIKEDRKKEALKLLQKNYDKLKEKKIYETFDYADFLKNNDQFKKSIKLYTQVIKKIDSEHPLYPSVLDGRGVAYERIGEWDNAEKDLLASLKASPNQAYVINYLAYTWVDKGINIKKSLEMLEKANNLKKNDPYIIDSLGWALFKIKRYKEAKKYLQMAVKLMPSDPTVNDHYGDSLWMNNKKIEARYYWNYVLNLKDVDKKIINNIKKKIISGIEANI
jgi:tetratricopeptide (TPR) repeat protein